ncbi:MAG: hypothetical protein K8H74_12380 [Notoacmeibacter sp.]|nr:hypothetical protein [Notoacmeibacter sp.]
MTILCKPASNEPRGGIFHGLAQAPGTVRTAARIASLLIRFVSNANMPPYRPIDATKRFLPTYS